MTEDLRLRRHLYECAATGGRRSRRVFRRQLRVLAAVVHAGPDDGAAGVREVRRPTPPSGPARAALRVPRG